MDWERILLLFKIMEHTRLLPNLKKLHDAAWSEILQNEASLEDLPESSDDEGGEQKTERNATGSVATTRGGTVRRI